jgi:hypothetical protein
METQTKEVQTLSLSGDKPNKEKKCSELVKEKYQDRLKQFETAKTFLDIEKSERNKFDEFLSDEYQELNQYEDFFDYVNKSGLCFDRVEAGTFKDQRAGYWRWQLSWGGPSEEFRLYDNNDLEYWYLDWFDGACVDVVDDVFVDIINYFKSLSVEE